MTTNLTTHSSGVLNNTNISGLCNEIGQIDESGPSKNSDERLKKNRNWTIAGFVVGILVIVASAAFPAILAAAGALTAAALITAGFTFIAGVAIIAITSEVSNKHASKVLETKSQALKEIETERRDKVARLKDAVNEFWRNHSNQYTLTQVYDEVKNSTKIDLYQV